MTRDDRVEATLTNLLSYMQATPKERIDKKIPMSVFDGAYVIFKDEGWWDAMADEGKDDRKFFDPEDFTPDVVPNLNVRTLCVREDHTELLRVQRVKPEQLRGRTRLFASVAVEVMSAHCMHRDGTYSAGSQFYGWRGSEWIDLGSTQYNNAPPPHDEQVDRVIRLAHSVAYTRDTEWTVRIGWVGRPKVEIPTDPKGAREIFKLRDLQDGETRRAALKHWVREHARRNRKADPSTVAEHLRGAEEFTWNNFYCRVQPSGMDLRRAARAKKSS